MKQLIKVIGVVLNTTSAIFYQEDGSIYTIPQGDPRLPGIVEILKKDFVTGKVLEIDVSEADTIYDTFSKNTDGVVKFFRVMKTMLDDLFNPTVESATFGAVDQIMANAISLRVKSPETEIVAVVNGSVVTGVEGLAGQIKHSINTNTDGMTRFLERLAAVADKRRHSADDLVKFLSIANLPISDDGEIIAYKLLQSAAGQFVDLHTNRVMQSVGDFVCMDESMVDPRRNRDCSNGLHIASQGYLRNFPGDSCFLVKIQPEDVIAVPVYDNTKMRVSGYHIIFQLTSEQMSGVKSGLPITESAGGTALLARAMTGDHITRIREVRIGGQLGTDINYTELAKADKPEHPSKKLKTDTTNAKVVEKSSNISVGALVEKVDISKVVNKEPTARQVKASNLYAAFTSSEGKYKSAALNNLLGMFFVRVLS